MTSPSRPLIALAAGGTGGHVFPAVAVAEALARRGADTMMMTDRRGARLLSGASFSMLPAGSPFQRGLLLKARAALQLGAGVLIALAMLRRRRPAAMVGFGGYPSFAPMLAARLTGIPDVLHEQNAHLGRANHLLARWCGHLALSWKCTRNLPDKVMHFVAGMPVRAAFLDIEELSDRDRDTMELTIVGGSLGASVFATMVPDALAQIDPALRAKVRVTQQCRAEQVDMLQARYRDIGIDAEISTFFDDMPDRFAKSDLVISRAGASSVAELAASGRPAILIPFAGAMDDHQTANARQLETAGGGICLAEAELDAAALAARITSCLSDMPTLAAMGHCGRSLAAADAADTIAGYALDLATSSGSRSA